MKISETHVINNECVCVWERVGVEFEMLPHHIHMQ